MKMTDIERILRTHLTPFLKEDRHLDFMCSEHRLDIKCLYYGDEVSVHMSQGIEGLVYSITCEEYSKDFCMSVINPFHIPYFVGLAFERLGYTSTDQGIDYDPLFSYSD